MILKELAQRYPQLYLVPGGNPTEYKLAATKGIVPEKTELKHFHTTSQDSLVTENTPAGDVEVLYLKDRQDFETFLQLLIYKGKAEPVPPTTGAMTLDGLVNWGKIQKHKEKYLAEGNTDWSAEFRRFTADRGNYRDTLIVLSDGPYSNIPGSMFGYGENEWLEISRTIRHYHELNHVICRRLYPGQISPVFDEVIADFIGIRSALGFYDKEMAARFLGVKDSGYCGGRLENYVQGQDLDELSKKIWILLEKIEKIDKEFSDFSSFEILELIQNKQSELEEIIS